MNELSKPSDKRDALNGFQETEPPRKLSNRDRDIFLALLDADTEPTEAAQNAAKRFNQGRHEGGRYHFQTSAKERK